MKKRFALFNPLTFQPLGLALFILLIFLPLLGGGNYFFSLSPFWGQFVLIMTAALLLLFQILASRQKGTVITFPVVDMAFICFISIATVSVVFSQNRPESAVALLSFWGSLSLAILVRLLLRTISGIEKAVKMILVSSVLVVFYEFYQSVWQFGAVVNEVSRNESLANIRAHFQVHRTPFSTFMTSNNLASYLLMMAPLNLCFILREGTENKSKWIGLFCLISAGIFLSGSKGAAMVYCYLLAAEFWLFYKVYNRELTRSLITVISAVLISALVTMVLWKNEWKPDKENSVRNMMSAYMMTGQKMESSMSGRVEYWKTAVKMWKDHWFTGTGIGTFATISPRYQTTAFYSRHAHDDYLEMLAETGVAGLAGFLSFLFLVIAYGVRVLRELKKRPKIIFEGYDAPGVYLLMASLLLSLSGFLLHALIDFNWEIMANRTMALLLTMMIIALSGMVAKVSPSSGKIKISLIRFAHPAIIGSVMVLVIVQGFWLPRITIAESYFALAEDPFETNLSRQIEYAENSEENFPYQSKYALFLAAAYEKRGLMTGNNNDMERAIKNGNMALKLAPLLPESHARQADLLSAQGKNNEAEAEWFAAIENGKMNLGYYNQLGLLYIKIKNYEKAKEILQKGLELEEAYKRANHPDLLEVARGNIYLGEIFEELHQPEESLKKYQSVVRFYDENPALRSSGNWNILQSGLLVNMVSFVHARSANIYNGLGNSSEAKKELQLAEVSGQ